MLVYGRNVLKEVLKKKIKINKVYIQDSLKSDFSLKGLDNVNIIYLKKYEMDKISSNHQGIILNIEDYKYVSLSSISFKNALLVILDHIEDPHNFGAIIRSCEAFGVDGIIIPSTRSIEVNSTVIKTSVGTVFNMKIAKVKNIVNTMHELKKNGFWIVGTDMEGTRYDEIDYKGSTCIVCGNEGFGMSRLVKENCDFIATIPMKGEVNSLNASVATAIVISQAVRNRRD